MPKFSVVIPTCRRPEALASCLACIAPGRQRDINAADYEVIVSDAAEHGTVEVMLRDRFPWAFWSSAPKHGPGPNRNAGVRHARGDWLVFVDDDCLPAPDWLARIAAHAAQSGVDVVEGAIHSPTLPDHPLWTAPVNTAGNAGWTANLSVRRALFEQLGGFDPDLPETAEDMEFHVRSKRAGARWVFAPDAIVVHPPRHATWRRFWRDTLRFRWWFMFRLKTGEGAGIDAGAWRTFTDVSFALGVLYARMTWQLLRSIGQRQVQFPLREIFLRGRDWVLFPVLLPYFWRWAMVYRRQLRRKAA